MDRADPRGRGAGVRPPDAGLAALPLVVCPRPRHRQSPVALGATGFYDWRSERELRYDNQYRGAFPYDGQLILGGATVGVKVDVGNSTTPSKLAETLVRTIRTATDLCDGLLYVCTGDTEPDTVLHTVDELTRHGVLDNGALTVAALDYDDLTDPDIPVLTPWGVA